MAPYMSHATSSELSSPVDSVQSPSGAPAEPIAIIGLSCKFSGDATTPEKLWQLVVDGRDGWSPIPKSRFNSDAFYDKDHAKIGMSNVVGGHFIRDDVSKFDASFFNFTAEIANAMDPQIRMLLESVFEALENAGIPLHKLAGSDTSVFMGSFSRDYHDSLMRDPDTLPRTALTGNGVAMMSNRISHFFDLRGPSLTTDTGCSASMAALHLAVQSIRNGESRMSVVGASNLLLNSDPFIVMSSLGVLGADGRCFAWDSRANGYGRGEGIATLLLKPLRDALADGDPVHAVIRETAINQDGKTPTITSPSSEAQEDLIRACYRRAGLDPSKTPYVEAHMTGTPTGDPIEASAISRVFGKGRTADNPVLVGSIKTNLGHLEASSGIAGVVKAVMMLKHGIIPPSLNYKEANPKIDMAALKVSVPLVSQNWPEGMARRVSVNNYGYGGTNGHVIIDGPNEHLHDSPATTTKTEEPSLVVLSSKDSTVTTQMVSNLKAYLESRKSVGAAIDFDDLAYTFDTRRSHFPWRVAISSLNWQQDLIEALDDPVKKAVTLAKEPPRIGFVFNGQGAQWYAMGRELISVYPTFQKSLLHADVVLADYGADWSLVEELQRDEKSTRVNEPRLSQPVCVALQICLVDLLKTWGIRPSAVTSHSSGEIAAAYAAGALTFEESLGVAYFRGALTEEYHTASSAPGGMMAVGLGSDEAWSYLAEHGVDKGTVTVACVNSPSSVTLSGDLDAIDRLEKDFANDQIFARKLKVKSAYHSHHMLPMADEYLKALKDVIQPKLKWNKIVYSSPVTGGLIESPEKLGPQHWVNNLLWPVLFSQSFEKMCVDTASKETNVDLILEIGPHSALAGPIRQICKTPSLKDISLPYASCLIRGQNAAMAMQTAAGSLWCKGYPVDLAAVNRRNHHETYHVVADLPSYPWNHTNSFWQESRLNVAHRNRKHVRHELLGSLLSGPAATSPTWRHFLKASELPWLRDHLVQSDIVYPGAGGISMAIEAIRQLSDSDVDTIDGYCLRDIQISNALVIPDTEAGIEVQLSLHPCDNKNLEPGWYEFSLKSPSTDGESWTEHIHGYISQRKKTKAVLPPIEASSSLSNGAQDSVLRPVEVSKLFGRLRNMGLQHGPTFQNMINIQAQEFGSKFQFQVADIKSASSHVLHPTTLDSIFQGAYAALSSDAYQNSMVMPRSIGEIFVAQSLPSSPGSQFQSLATVDKQDRSGFRSSITTSDPQHPDTPLLEVKGLFCQAVGGVNNTDASENANKLLFKMLWHPDMTLMPSETIVQPLRFEVGPQELSVNKKLVRAAWHFIQDAIQDLSSDEQALADMEWYHKSLYNWMQSNYEAGLVGSLARGSASWAKASKGMKHMLFDEVAAQSVNGRLLCRIGRNLSQILRKQVAPLEVMMEGNLLYEFYEKALRCNRSYAQVQELVHLYSMKNPRAKVLEIGGGTGGCTGSVLKGLTEDTPDGRYRFSSYTFTDVSAGFFEAAAKKFGDYGDMISYKKLDIEADPTEQSFTPGSYDLIIACQVLHATKNMEKTMKNVRSLLKPGGKLILVETTKDTLDVQLIFGALPGWWLAEESERKGGPNLTVDHWSRVLNASGFSRIDLEVRDMEDEANYSFSVMTSTATAPTSYPSEVTILSPSEKAPAPWLQSLQSSIQRRVGASTTVEDWKKVDATDKVCIMLVEMVAPLLSRLTKDEFASIQRLLTTARGVLWVTRASLIEGLEPDMAMHSGLLRTLRMEDAGRRYVSLDLDTKDPVWSERNVDFIANVFATSFDFSQSSKDIDCEYAVDNSLIHISRIYNDDNENKAFAPEGSEPEPEIREFDVKDSKFDLQMEVGTAGLLDTLRFREVERDESSLGADQIEIEPRAFGLNFRDVLVALGQLDETIMGYECSGVVTRLGADAQRDSDLKVGDRVCAILRGHWATRVTINWPCAVRIPDNMSFEEAATVPMVFATAYYGLYDIGRLTKGENVLIHAATGGVGQAAVMLAQHRGANVFVTVGTEAKRDFVMKEFGIPRDHIFSSRDTSFGPALKAATNGRGADVVLNSLSGALLKESWNCMARFGRFVEIGKRDMEAAKHLDMSPLRRAVSFAAVDLFQLGKYKGQAVQDVLQGVMEMFGNGQLRVVAPMTTYPISEVDKAFRLMQSGKHLGKIVVTPKKTDLVRVIPCPKPARLSPDATYVIVGGMGGIGQSIARWMARSLGCKNLIILSRSARTHPDSEVLISDLKAAGCNLFLENCDVSKDADFRRVLDQASQSLPPVRGVIQAAMTLNDSIFPNMTYDQWLAATGPKVAATWNIHNTLPDLDFFVMLSSLTGLGGNTSQANYSAGGTFQDAFAKFRTSQSLPAVSIDLASIQEVGFVANTEGVAERLTKTGLADISEAQMLKIVETAIQHPLRPVALSQLITGILEFDEASTVAWVNDKRFTAAQVTHNAQGGPRGRGDQQSQATARLSDSLQSATSGAGAVVLILDAIISKLGEMFGLDAAEIDKKYPVSKYGVDSLIAVELRNWLVSSAGAETTSIFDVLHSPSLSVLAEKIGEKSRFVSTLVKAA
ncbi:Highly reducing polyketide synthase azaB [Colletotrichum fructicola]|nr:Highly reducing polyketide synthase azaB [Colletotrichum fructicola]KAF4916684.1 Highly reducing polyketide synthase azaB [Colletotrichum fructicola]